MPRSLAIILFAAWLLGFTIAVALVLVVDIELEHESGREITSIERVLVISLGCVFWFVFFLPPFIEYLKRKD